LGDASSYLSPEARARVEIDQMLVAAGWAVQHSTRVTMAAGRGVAVREFVMASPHGRADYLLFLDGHAAGVVEAKKEGETLIGVEHQSAKYVDGLPGELEPAVEGGLAFVYESTGTETRFTNRLDPDPTSRPVFSFHRPETLVATYVHLLADDAADAEFLDTVVPVTDCAIIPDVLATAVDHGAGNALGSESGS
jgi:type I restriction enzyme R subunit